MTSSMAKEAWPIIPGTKHVYLVNIYTCKAEGFITLRARHGGNVCPVLATAQCINNVRPDWLCVTPYYGKVTSCIFYFTPLGRCQSRVCFDRILAGIRVQGGKMWSTVMPVFEEAFWTVRFVIWVYFELSRPN